MFYSHCLLSKKGSLGTIWVAAHCHKRLKKEDISQTNISSSVDKILLDEVPFVTYRILGFLLLGVVRIYSKKVEYLVRDCRDVLSEVCHFVSSKKSNDDVEVMCAPYSSITVPERFELDAFDLDVIEDLSRDHTKTQEEITLKGKKIRIWSPSLHQSYFEEDTTYFRDYSAGKNFESVYAMTTEMIASSSNNLRSLEESAERLRSNRFVLEECLPPMIFDEAEERAYPGRTLHEDNHAKGVEMLKSPSCHVMLGDDVRPANNDECLDEEHGDLEQTKFSRKCPMPISIHTTPELKVPDRLSLDESLPSMMFDEAEERADPRKTFNETNQTDGVEMLKPPSSHLMLGDDVPTDDDECLDEEHADLEQTKFSPKHPVSISTYATPELKVPNRPYLEECLPSMIFDEAEELADPTRTFHETNQTKGVEMMKPPTSHIMLKNDGRPRDNDDSLKEKHADSRQTKFSQVTGLRQENIHITSPIYPMSISIHAAPGTKVSDSAGATTPVLMAVRTPAAKESARISKKRKCLYDDNRIVIPNEIYKAALDDPSDLVKKRRKTLLCNSAVKMSDKIFFEPLTPCVSINIRSLLLEKERKNPEKIETTNTPTKSHDVGSLASDEIHGENAVASIKAKDTPTKTQDIGSHTSDKTHREDTIAPSTPVNSSLSLRHTFGTTTTETLGCTRSFASVDRVLSPSEDSEFDASLMTQEEEIEFCEGDDKEEKYRWSARTRAVASFLCNEFFDRKKRGADEVLKFSQILEGKSKKRSARIFYELLVLKTQGFLNVKQENLYDDISVVGTSKLSKVFEVDDMA